MPTRPRPNRAATRTPEATTLRAWVTAGLFAVALVAARLVSATAVEGTSLHGSPITPATGRGPLTATEPVGALEEPDPSAQALTAGANASWWHAVTTDLARAEYDASRTTSGLQAPNRAHNLRTRFGARGIEVVPREGDRAPAWRCVWETARFGRPGTVRSVDAAIPEPRGGRVTYRRPEFDEWYDNSHEGLEQGFTIHAPPPGEGPLCIVGRFAGVYPVLSDENEAVDLLDHNGARVLRYGELHVWDARGDELPSRFDLAGADLALLVEDGGALYPLTVDPLMTSPAWTTESNQASALYGWSVATAGDVNGDGYSDVIVGAHGYDNGQADEGRAYVYHGSPTGLATTAAWAVESNQVNAQLGYSVATAGDVNGDGFSDVIVAAYVYSNGESVEGRAFVYHGSSAGLSTTAAWTAEGNQTGARFGSSVATAGDVNGDGFSDVIVGAYAYQNGQFEEGRAYVYHGSSTGLATNAAWTAESDQSSAWFGYAVGTAGDVNGDGFSDVIVGSYFYDNGHADEGRAYVYHGSAMGLATSAAWTAESDQTFGQLGRSVATAGDVNGDGFSDVIVGADFYTNGETFEGRAFVYHGSSTGLAPGAAWSAEGNQASAFFGFSVGTAGDVNGDGYADVIVGAYRSDGGQTDEGRAFVYHGSAAGLGVNAAWSAENNQAGSELGIAVATAGDVNGDGFSDVIVGAWRHDNGETNEGRAYIYHGAAAGLATAAAWSAESDQTDAAFGFWVATAGDVNGDGFSDVIVGAARYDNGEVDEGRAFAFHGSAAGLSATPDWTAESDQAGAYFGVSVATAGDVNGDGYSDIIVGASFYDNGETDEGRAFVYLGSPAGLAPGPAWTAESDQADAYLGHPVATAGDVNGDGFSDVIAGAHFFDNEQQDEGRALVYHGSSDGLATSPAWTAEGDQMSALFGFPVATAGDVNGDGFSDVVVGAHFYDNPQAGEGRAYVYHGSSTGLSATPAWTAESDQVEARFGVSAGTAGDVNGDGYSDLIVGAYFFDGGLLNEGRAFVYHGSAAGLAASPAWTADGDQEDARFGHPVATAGDVNGDGFSDVIIGAVGYDNGQSSEGLAFVYHGSATGLSTLPVWIAEGDQVGANLGNSAGTAGDVNGDGFSDVVVGAYRYNNGQSGEGRALVYYGNEGHGMDRIARQARTDDSAPIASLGRSDDDSAFRLKARGRTAAGRGRVRLQFEVKPLGVPFDGMALITGGPVDTGVPIDGTGSAVSLSELASGLTPETAHGWRLRVLSDSPFFPSTPWLVQPYTGRTEIDLRTGASTSGIAGEVGQAEAMSLLEPMRPNPLLTHGEIAYRLPQTGDVRLTVVDAAGRERAVLQDAVRDAGHHVARWDGRDARGHALPAGVYMLRLEAAGRVSSRKVVISR